MITLVETYEHITKLQIALNFVLGPSEAGVSKACLKGLKIRYLLEHVPVLGDFGAGENLENLLMMQLLMEKWANGSLGGRRAKAVWGMCWEHWSGNERGKGRMGVGRYCSV